MNPIIDFILNLIQYSSEVLNLSFREIAFIRDLTIFSSGIFIGGLLTTYLNAKMLGRTFKVDKDKFGKLSIIKVKNGKYKETFLINDNDSVMESMKILLTLAFNSIIPVKGYVKQNPKRTKIFVGILIALGVFGTLITLALFTSPVLKKILETMPK